jgi:hypothetical protein
MARNSTGLLNIIQEENKTMGNVSRTAPVNVGAGQSVSPATNLAEETRVAPWLFDKALEGSIFMAGYGAELAATDGEAALDETTPTFILMAPASGTIVIPIWAQFRCVAEGGAAQATYLTYIGVDRTSGATYTTLSKLQIGGSATTSAAIAGKTVSTLTAITDPQNILLERRANLLDNLISVEMATTKEVQTFSKDPLTLEVNFMQKFGGAFYLSGGRSIAFYSATGTTDSTYSCSIMWAEIPASTYGKS